MSRYLSSISEHCSFVALPLQARRPKPSRRTRVRTPRAYPKMMLEWAHMSRAMNFNAGPAALPLAALERAKEELLDFENSGMSVMEHSHRGKVYEKVHGEAIALVAKHLGTPLDTW